MKAEEYRVETRELAGWLIRLTTYRIGHTYHCQADNVSPGAVLARTSAESREEALEQAVAKAGKLLGRTQRHEP